MSIYQITVEDANKEKVIHHFRQLLEEILPEPKNRISTKIPNAEREARILDKKYQSQKKQNRQNPSLDY